MMTLVDVLGVAAACGSGAAVIIFSGASDGMKVFFTVCMVLIASSIIGSSIRKQSDQEPPIGPVKPA